MRRFFLPCILALLALAGPASGQAAVEGAPKGATSADGLPAAEAATSLSAETMALDISTASFYELAAWAGSLGLPSTGSAQELRGRLYDYYKVKAPAATESSRTIRVERANRAEYFRIEGSDSSIMRVSGGVILTLKDEEKDESHRLEADEIIYDRDRDSITAKGDVRYRRERGSNIEEFSGETLAVDLADWSGVFLDGQMRKGAQSGGAANASAGERAFAFRADTIVKRSGNVIILDNGVISACDAADPHYSIRAKRLWLLGDNEWAVSNAVLSIGELPVLWLPFFYYPSEEIVFHPYLGYRAREGRFVQTTTYLIGRKPAAKNPGLLSMMAGDPNSAKELHGFFLEPVPGTSAPAEGGSSLKVLADFYSSLGAMVGIDGSFPKAGPVEGLKFSLELGESRSVFPPATTGAGYSPFLESLGWKSLWNTTQLFASSVPLRWAAGLEGSVKAGSLRASLSLPFFSDPYFEQDFLGRSEDMDWLGLSGTSTTSTTATTSTTPSVRTALTQKADLSWSWRPAELSPWLSSVELSRLGSSLAWLSKANTDATTKAAPDYSVNPSRTFLYPSLFKPVDASLSLRGSLVPKSGSGDSKKASPAAPGKRESGRSLALDPPWDGEKAAGGEGGTSDKGETAAVSFEAPARAPDFPKASEGRATAVSLDWSLNPTFLVENRLLTDGWKSPGDIDFSDLLYNLASWRVASALSGGITLPGGQAQASFSVNFQAQDQERTIPDAAKKASLASLLASYKSTDDQFRQAKITSGLKLQLSPFSDSWLLSPTALSYALDASLYQYYYDSTKAGSADPYSIKTVLDDGNAVTTNAATLTFGVKTGAKTQSLGLSMNLLPAQTAFSGSLALAFGDGGLSGDLSMRGRAWKNVSIGEAGTYSWDPVSASASLQLPLGLKLTDSFAWDTANTRPKSNSAGLAWGPLSLGLQSGWGIAYTPKKGQGWVAVSGSEDFRSSSCSASLKSDWKSPETSAISYGLSLSASYTQSLIRFSESVLSFGLGLNLKVTDSLELSFSSQSQNSSAWRYWPWLFPDAENLGFSVDTYFKNPAADIWESFSFWDPAARKASLFKLKNIQVKLVRHLHDWDLSFSLQASPKLDTTLTPKAYVVDPTFQFLVTWKDMSSIKAALNKTSSGLSW